MLTHIRDLKLTHQEPEQSTKGDVKDSLYAGYLSDYVYRIILGCAIEHTDYLLFTFAAAVKTS